MRLIGHLFQKYIGMELPSRIVLKSWNASLHPPRGEGHIGVDLALDNINRLLEDCDLLYLCEFDCTDIDLSRKLESLFVDESISDNNFFGLGFIPLYHSQGKVCHKSALLYNQNMFIPQGAAEHFYEPASCIAEGSYRVGQLVSFGFVGQKKLIHCFCSHWPGRNEQNGGLKKIDAASALYSQIKEKNSDDFVVCMGDYNAEPHEEMFSYLGASRSQEYVRKRRVLYNPFWQYLRESDGTLEYCETSRYKAPRLLYDQIMVNNSLLEDYDVKASIIDLGRALERGEHKPVSLKLERRYK